MSDSAEKTETKPFDSEYYKWSKQINESKKVSVILSNHNQELERLGVDISPTRIQGEVAEHAHRTPGHLAHAKGSPNDP